MPTAKTPTDGSIRIDPVRTDSLTIGIRGIRPLILNRMSEKARRELLMPSGRKTAADKAAVLKHTPSTEFQAAPYRFRDDDTPTLLGVPSSMFKGAMMVAALDLPGAKRTQIGRLLWVEGDLTAIYGVPQIFLAVTRSADINRTPDIRTRAIVPAWAAMLTISFVTPMINATSVINLLSGAGQIAGIGDWRPEKGKGTFGQFVITNADDDAAFLQLLQTGGRAAQQAAMDDPEPYDDETGELLSWFDDELDRRGRSGKPATAKATAAAIDAANDARLVEASS